MNSGDFIYVRKDSYYYDEFSTRKFIRFEGSKIICKNLAIGCEEGFDLYQEIGTRKSHELPCTYNWLNTNNELVDVKPVISTPKQIVLDKVNSNPRSKLINWR